MELELINKLKNESVNSTCKKHKHSAAIFDKNNIFSIGFNHYINGDLMTLHAEIHAISRLPRDLIYGKWIMVIRVNTKSELKNSRPCNECIDKLKKKGIKKVFYSNDDGKIIIEIVNDMKYIHTSYRNRKVK